MPKRKSSALLACIILCTLWLSPQATAAQNTSATALALKGQFKQLLTQLEQLDTTNDDQNQLRNDLKQYLKHQAQRKIDQAKEYKEAFDEMNDFIKKDKMEDALISAIKAHDEAIDPAQFLDSDAVKKLVNISTQKATAALKKQQWIDAWTLYRLLDRLYIDQKRFDKQVKQAAEHVRITRLYAPDKLQKLFEQRAKRMSKEKPEPLTLGQETWDKKLKEVQLKMLITSLDVAKQKHIFGKSYKHMLLASLDSLSNLVNTPSIHPTLAKFKNRTKALSFKNGIKTLKKFVHAEKEFDRKKLFKYLNIILGVNEKTIQLDHSILAYEMATAAMASLDDYSAVIWPHDLKMFLRTLQGNFKGIGVQIRMSNKNELTVITPLVNTPAYRAGFKAKDIITHVNGKNIASWTLNQAIRNLTGPENTKVKVTVKRKIKNSNPKKDNDKTAKKDDDKSLYKSIQYTITRKEIPIETVKGWELHNNGSWDFYIDRKNKIGYVRVSQFQIKTAEQLQAAVDQMKRDNGLNALILDLRYNPGGLLSTAIKMVDKFVDKGTIVSTKDKNKHTNSLHPASPHRTTIHVPVVVLINQGSASASEIVSGALQDLKRAYIVGENSFGKGSVQNTIPFPARARTMGQAKWLVKITTDYYALPSGRIIHRLPTSKKWGIQPDLTIAMTPTQLTKRIEARQAADVLTAKNVNNEKRVIEEKKASANDILAQGLDPQLDAAIIILKTKLLQLKNETAKK